MRALITGSDGFAGKWLARSLRDDGHEVTGFDIRSGRDVRDYEQVCTAVDETEPDLIFHLAATASPAEALRDPRRATDIIVMGTLNVLEAVRVTGCDARILVAGSSDEYGYEDRDPAEVLTEDTVCRPRGPYGAAKLAATAMTMGYVRSCGLRAVVTRAFMHTGPGRKAVSVTSLFARRIVTVERGEADHVVHGDLGGLVDLTDVRDVVAAYRAAVMQAPGIWNVCREDLVSLREVMDVLVSLSTAGHVPLKEDPSLGTRRAANEAQIPRASAAKLREAAGWEPRIGLETMLGGVLDYWRAR